MYKAQRQRDNKTKRQGESASRLCLLVCLSACLLVFLAVGCESGFGARQQGDPLFGFSAAPKPSAQPSTSGNAVAQATSGPIPVPPMPSSHSAPGTAPVASGESATPEDPRDLRMAGGAMPPSNAPSPGAARGAAPVVTVGNPEPAPTGTTANMMKPPVAAPTGSAANIRTYEEAQQFLTQQHISWQRLDMEDGQWKFECGVPNPSNPQINRHYVTSRAFPDPLSAMREVIAQLEKKGP